MLCFPLLNVRSSSPLVLQRTHPGFKSKLCTSSLHFFPSSFSCHLRNFLASSLSFSASFAAASLSASSSNSTGDDFNTELDRLLALLPEEMRRKVSEHPERHQLIEVVMDFGRRPLARFPTGDFILSENAITLQDIENATSQVSFWLLRAKCLISVLCGSYCSVTFCCLAKNLIVY